jgi:hypothetical protein
MYLFYVSGRSAQPLHIQYPTDDAEHPL